MMRSIRIRANRAAAGAALAIGLAAAMAAATPALANGGGLTYEVTITNATYGQRFTPLLLVTHEPALRLFDVGAPASPGLATLAEEGNVGPLREVLDAEPRVIATAAGAGLTEPGATTTLTIRALPNRHRLSLAAMLIPTNDAFVALDSVELPYVGSVTYVARAYDAGSESNNELCAFIPGPGFPECGGPGGGGKAGNGEGFVHVHRGIHGVGDLHPADRAWSNPVAIVRIRRVH
jgi:Spondin_N